MWAWACFANSVPVPTLVQGAGFEPAKPLAADLQSAGFVHSPTPAQTTILTYAKFKQALKIGSRRQRFLEPQGGFEPTGLPITNRLRYHCATGATLTMLVTGLTRRQIALFFVERRLSLACPKFTDLPGESTSGSHSNRRVGTACPAARWAWTTASSGKASHPAGCTGHGCECGTTTGSGR